MPETENHTWRIQEKKIEIMGKNSNKEYPFWDETLSVEQRVEDLISRLTPDEN